MAWELSLDLQPFVGVAAHQLIVKGRLISQQSLAIRTWDTCWKILLCLTSAAASYKKSWKLKSATFYCDINFSLSPHFRWQSRRFTHSIHGNDDSQQRLDGSAANDDDDGTGLAQSLFSRGSIRGVIYHIWEGILNCNLFHAMTNMLFDMRTSLMLVTQPRSVLQLTPHCLCTACFTCVHLLHVTCSGDTAVTHQ